MNQTAEHTRGTGLSLLSPSHLIDWFLDQLEKMSTALMPVQAGVLSCRETQVETGFERLGS